MANQKSGTNPLIKLGAIGVGAYLLYKILKPANRTEDSPKEIYRCGNCTGVIVGRPLNCPWCGVQIDWRKFL
jgi:hypothetical protein